MLFFLFSFCIPRRFLIGFFISINQVNLTLVNLSEKRNKGLLYSGFCPVNGLCSVKSFGFFMFV